MVETEIGNERVRAAFQQIPVAALVTVVNAALMLVALEAAIPGPDPYTWAVLVVLVAAGRLGLWRLYHLTSPGPEQYRAWLLVSAWGAFAAGVMWGGGAVALFTDSDVYQLLWVFVIGGMCAGAAALHHAHLPTALGFIIPAALPVAVRLSLEGTRRETAAAAMIVVFLAAMVETTRRSSRAFADMLRLRIDLAQRERDLVAANAKLRQEMAEHQATEATLRQAQKMEAVGQLTGGIAHDFNNLLTAVIGSLLLLRRRLPGNDERCAGLLENAIRGAERGAALTQRLLAFGRRQALTPQVVDLSGLIQGILPLLRTSLGSSVQVTMRLAENLPAVKIDANQLELALLNLSMNAKDAMPEGGEIKIVAHEEHVRSGQRDGLPPDDYVVLSVSDTGEGMDDPTLARAMEPFFTTKGVGKGTGLGLAMVHGLMAQSGGMLRLRSQKGTGTVAELWLPRARSTPEPLSPRPQAGATTAAQSRRVMVVDDDQLVRVSTAAILEELGHAAVVAESGLQALEQLCAGVDVDLVITDYAMPGMTGLQLIEELRRLRPGLIVVLATGYAEIQALETDEIVRMAKPFTPDSLAQVIARSFGAVAVS